MRVARVDHNSRVTQDVVQSLMGDGEAHRA